MRKIKARNALNLVFWVLISLLFFVIIWSFSCQSYSSSHEISGQVADSVKRHGMGYMLNGFTGKGLEYNLRKIGHIVLYAVFTESVIKVGNSIKKNFNIERYCLLVNIIIIIVPILMAIADEGNQFLRDNGRGASVADIFYDAIGIIIVIVTSLSFKHLRIYSGTMRCWTDGKAKE